MKELQIQKGDMLFRAGDFGDCMYCVRSGKVGIYVNYGQPAEKLLAELGKGRYLGEMAVIDKLPRSADAVALEDTTLSVTTSETLIDFIAENPQVSLSLIKNLSGRLRALTDDYMDACKTMSEVVEEQKEPKKSGLWDKLRKYARIYAEATAEAYSYMDAHGNPMPTYISPLDTMIL